MAAPTKFADLSSVEAAGIVDDLKYSRTDIRNPALLSDKQKLALGTVMLTMWVKESKSQRTIADEMHVSLATVSRYINRALDAVAFSSVNAARAQLIQQLDELLEVWVPKAKDGDEKAAAVVAKFLEQRAKASGGFAPIEISQTVTEISLAEREMQALIAEENAENAIREDGVEVEQ